MLEFVWLVPLFPAIGFLINGLFGRRMDRRAVGPIACAAIGLSAIFSCFLFFALLKEPDYFFEKNIFAWVVSGELETSIGYQVDALSIVMALVVSWVSFFIHIYSIGYMHDDPGYPRYFTYLNLFVFMMLNLVLANNFLLMFVGWEGVGLCSYLLIGFCSKRILHPMPERRLLWLTGWETLVFFWGFFSWLFTLEHSTSAKSLPKSPMS